MSERAQNFGHAVENGVVRYFSPSSLSKADPNQYGGCLRRWFFCYVLGKKEPFTASQKVGVETHGQIENYLTTGEKFLGPIAMAGARFIPAPGPENAVEFTMVVTERVGEIDVIRQAPLTAAGIPVVGFGDLLIRNAADYVDDEGDRRPNRPGTVEVVDWKTTSNFENAKPGSALPNTIQMTGYGEWAARTSGTPIDWIRMSHVYFLTKGRPSAIKRSALVSREDNARRWELAEGVARKAIDAARETDASKVPGNKSACGAWRGCPHASYCTIRSEASIDDLLGQTMSKEINMSLTGKLALLGGPAAPPTAAPAPEVKLDFKAQMEALKAEEAAALAAAQAPAAVPAVAVAPLPIGFARALSVIEKGTMGMPKLNAVVAAAWAQARGIPVSSIAAPAGILAGLTLEDPALVLQLALELDPTFVAAEPVQSATPATAGLLPPDAPASNPAIASLPVEGLSPPAPVAEQIAAAFAEGPLAVSAPSGQAAEPDTTKKKAGRPKKSNSPIAQGPTGSAQEPQSDEGETEIYLNALPRAGTPYQNLGTYIDALNASLSKDFGCADVRQAPKGSPLEFGQWKGVVAAVARQRPPAAGVWVLIARTEVDDIIADALKDFVVATGVR